MKKYVLAFVIFSSIKSFAQSALEKEILQLSDRIFTWEVENKIDSLEIIFHPGFVVVGSDGNSQLKNQYISKLKNGSFIHDSIGVEAHSAVVSGNTAVVSGKGKFSVTASGKKVQLHLSYMEVFTRENERKRWQVLAMKASVLNN